MEDTQRMDRLEAMLERLLLQQPQAPHGGNRDVVPNQGPRFDDRGLKLEVNEFDGASSDPEVFLEWERSLERFFEYKDTTEEHKYKLAKLKLVKSASVWFEGLQKQRVREERGRIDTWPKLKKHLHRKYVPSNYKQTLYIKWSTLQQNKKSVAEYTREFEKLTIDCDILENEDMKLARFIGGLNEDLRDKLETHYNMSYEEACKMASTYERQRKKKGGESTFKPAFNKANQTSSWNKGSTSGTKPVSFGSSNNKFDKPKPKKDLTEVVCFKCHGTGHYKNECPNARAFTSAEWNHIQGRSNKRAMIVLTEEGEEDLKYPMVDPDAPEGTYKLNHLGEMVLCATSEDMEEESTDDDGDTHEKVFPEVHLNYIIRRNCHAAPVEKKTEQRENIFQTKCRIQEELCDLIIDGGSETNCVDMKLVNSDGVVKIDGLLGSAYEMMYRINVGGPKVTPFNDSLWRSWENDDGFLEGGKDSKEVHFGGRIKYRDGGASREVAPDNVYNSARVIGVSSFELGKSYVIWGFRLLMGRIPKKSKPT